MKYNRAKKTRTETKEISLNLCKSDDDIFFPFGSSSFDWNVTNSTMNKPINKLFGEGVFTAVYIKSSGEEKNTNFIQF